MMHRGTLAVLSTAIATGVLAASPVAMGRNGADDGAARVSADDSTARISVGDDTGVVRALKRAKRKDVRVRGVCTASSSAKLKLSPENGRVEVEFEVDENRNGSRWGVVLKRSGKKVLRRAATTRGPSGSFEVRTVIRRGVPRTTVVAVARRSATGEVCRARATL